MHKPDRRRLLQLLLLAPLPALIFLGKGGSTLVGEAAAPGGVGSEHDFDFFLGAWKVRHRGLKKRLAQSNDWEEFDGTTTCQSILGGMANFNDSVSHRQGGVFRGMGLRTFDAKSGTWADFWLDARNPHKIAAPGIGRFQSGIGTFFSDEEFEGRQVEVRGVFTSLTPSSMQWEQAFSPDGGKTWETNWVMRYTRV